LAAAGFVPGRRRFRPVVLQAGVAKGADDRVAVGAAQLVSE
jgi:hypothetical protein